MGTPEFAVPALGAVAAACDVTLVVTQPDRPAGRGRQPAASAVAEAAGVRSLPLWKPDELKSDAARERLAAERPDLFAVVAFGAILTPGVLAVPPLGSINLHGSLLPDYRGAAPVQRALWDGRTETGVCTLFMDAGIDTGDIILSERTAIDDAEDAGTLGARLAGIGAPLLARSLLLAAEGRAPRSPQDPAAGSYARKLRKSDGVMEWGLDARVVWQRARAVTPWPGATTFFAGTRLLVTASEPRERIATVGEPGRVLAAGAEGIDVCCGAGALRLIRVKPEGRAGMSAAEWARGVRLEPGARFAPEKEFSS